MSNTITQLKMSEDVKIQPKSIKVLQKNLGLEGWQDVIERAVYEMSERLGRLEQAVLNDEVEKIRRISKSLIGISDQVGLDLFSKIAADVVYCSDKNDIAAVYSVTTRLLRVGEASLFAAVESSHLS